MRVIQSTLDQNLLMSKLRTELRCLMEKGRVYALGSGELIAWNPSPSPSPDPSPSPGPGPSPSPSPGPSPSPSPNPNPNPNPNPSPSPKPNQAYSGGRDGFAAHAKTPHYARWAEFKATEPFSAPAKVGYYEVYLPDSLGA